MTIMDFLILIKDIFSKEDIEPRKIEEKGLLAVKIAQHFALRADFLSPEKCARLSLLFRNNQEVAPAEMERLLNKYAPNDWREKFSKIDERPVATASVGQVHKGELKDGSKVAVKIIKNIDESVFLNDIDRIKRFFRVILFFYPRLRKVFDPIGVLDYIKDYSLNELDLRNEIKGENELFRIYSENKDVYDFSYFRFHQMYPELSGKKILVSRFIEAKSFDELMEENKLDYHWILRLFQIHGFYLFAKGVFHGDIHPGNIFLWENKICFIDTGALTEINDTLRVGLFYFFEALSRYEYEQCVHYLQEMSVRKLKNDKYRRFEKSFYSLYEDFENKTVSEVSLTKKMMDTIKLAVRSGMEFDRGMFSIIKSLMYMDGMVLRVNKNVNLMKNIRDFVEVLKPFV